ncbi:MAG: hypothetical protein ACYC33_08960 [Thermoleophilia bacterium]
MVQSEAVEDASPTSGALEDPSPTSGALDDASATHVVGRRFSVAPPDRLTTLLVGFTVFIMGALALGGILQAVLLAQDGDLTGSLRGAGFALLGVVVVVLVWVRIPTAYGFEKDAVLGTLLRIERRRLAPVRLVLARYESVEVARRVVFPWVPLLSGSRFLGLRGARFEESIAGFWSFGRDGRSAVVFTGTGRPRTLVAPLDPNAFLDAIRQSADLQHLIAGETSALAPRPGAHASDD